MGKIIEKKILSSYFNAVLEDKKHFELRLDEDDAQEGDILVLKEWDNSKYTGNKITKKITYVLRNCPEYGLKDGYCIIGF